VIALGVLTNVTNSGILNIGASPFKTFTFFKTVLHEIIITYQIVSLSGGTNSSYSLLFTVLHSDDTNVGHIYDVSGSSYMQSTAISQMYQDTTFNGNNTVVYSNQPVLSKGAGVYTNSCSFRFLVPVLSTSETYKIAAVCNQVCNLSGTYCTVNYLG
jgi:predicted transcriptional regulator